MKSNKEYLDENHLNHIQDLLKDNILDKIIDPEIKIEEDITYGDEIPELVEKSFPGLLKLRMDAFKMNLYMVLQAPINSSETITILDIKSKVKPFGIFCESRVDWEIVRDIYDRVIFDGELVAETIIATGKPVKFNVLEHIIIKDGLHTDLKPEIIGNNQVNFHHINSFVMVAKGEYLGDLIPELPGVDGENLNGDPIKAPKKTINQFVIGSNVVTRNGKLYSEIDGSFKIIKNEISVDEVLQITTDIDYHTGDIQFAGDINIKESIREGFSVESGKNILVEESIEPTNIDCGNNLFVKHGIIGSDKYEVHVKGTIDALHIENAIIKCHGNITIEKGIVNSFVCGLDKLIIGDKSTIVGGKVNIQNGVVAGNIGNKHCVETKINVGVDYEIEEKLHKIQITSADFISEMDKLQVLIQRSTNREERDKIKYIFLQVKSRLNSLNNYSRALLSRLDKNDKSSVTVLGNIYPGVNIEICHINYMVEKKLTKVIFKLDKESGSIKYISL